jgi:hypothetical protein
MLSIHRRSYRVLAPPTVCDILGSLSDKKSFLLFKAISGSCAADEIEITADRSESKQNNDNQSGRNDHHNPLNFTEPVELTRKQFYSRLSMLTKAGLMVKKSANNNNKRYSLTSIGKVVQSSVNVIEDTLTKDYWKLKAIDDIEFSATLTRSQYEELVGSLLSDNEKAKEVVLSWFLKT